MRLASAVPASLRGAALMPAAVLGVHQLRYVLAYGDGAHAQLAAQGHQYLFAATPWLVLLASLSLGASLGSLARRWARGGGGRTPAGLRVWLLASLALFALYSGQELLEGALAAGHAAGIAGVVGDGGWWALPAALAIGGVLALALRSAEAVVAAVSARVLLQLRARPARPFVQRPAPAPARRLAAPLACAAAGRAPPALRPLPLH